MEAHPQAGSGLRKAAPDDGAHVPILLTGATLATLAGDGPLVAATRDELGLSLDASLLIEDGRIVALGSRARVAERAAALATPPETFDMGGRLVTPGLIDAHTHLLWAGDRAQEFERRLEGESYLDIMAEGGGIAATVRATRAADDEALLRDLLDRLDRLLDHGVTMAEVKTGYGLSVEHELRHLAILAEADRRHAVRVVPTFLGAHALPDEYRGRQSAYVDLVVEEMLPRVASEAPRAFCDVFCDEGAFTLAETARILERAHALGLRSKLHSDEFANLGATRLGAEMGCTSADHLVHTRPEEMDAMARAGMVAVILPGTTIGLGSTRFADGAEMSARGVAVAIGTDCNPGTCPCESLPLMFALVTRYGGLTPAQALAAATRNAAAALDEARQAGSLAPGRPADLCVFDAGDPRDLAYAFGTNPVAGAMVGGRWARPIA